MNSSWSRRESKFGNVMDVSAHVVFKIIFSFSVFASFTSAVCCSGCSSSTEICGLATSCSKELQRSGNDEGGDGGRGGGGGNSSSVK